MLVAMVTGFLFFNFLAIFNNVLELLLHQFHLSETLYALLVEVSTILVNLNACVTIVIYLVFGTKFRQVFFKVWALAYDRTRILRLRPQSVSMLPV